MTAFLEAIYTLREKDLKLDSISTRAAQMEQKDFKEFVKGV